GLHSRHHRADRVGVCRLPRREAHARRARAARGAAAFGARGRERDVRRLVSTPVPAREGEGGGEPVRARSLRIAFLMPLVVFLALAALFFARLWHGDDPSEIPSALIGKPVPAFVLPPVEGLTEEGQPVPGFSNADLGKGEVTLVNVWGSWCLPCREE